MKAITKTNYRTTYHRGGTVSYWDVYRQQWRREAAHSIRDEVLASMNGSERTRIERMTFPAARLGEPDERHNAE